MSNYAGATQIAELFTLLLSWLELVRLLRFVEPLEFLVPMLNMILFGIKWFFMVLVAYVVMMIFMIMALSNDSY